MSRGTSVFLSRRGNQERSQDAPEDRHNQQGLYPSPTSSWGLPVAAPGGQQAGEVGVGLAAGGLLALRCGAWGAGALRGVPGVEASLPRAAGPGSLRSALCALTKPRAVCTWPRCPGCGAGRGSGRTFLGAAFSLRPGVGRGPSQGQEPGQGAAAIAAPTPVRTLWPEAPLAAG